GRINAIDTDEEITLVSVQNMDEEMFDVNILDGEEVFVAEQEVAVKDVNNVVSTAGDATTTATITTVDDITLAQALMEIKSTKPKGKGVVIQDLEPVKPIKKKDLIRLDEEATLKLQAEFDEEEGLAREKAKKEKEANIALIETDEDRLKLNELMALCTTLQNWVLDLEKTKTTQHNEIASLKWRVKKLEKKNRSRTHKLKRLYKVGLTVRVESSDNEESLGEDASKQGRIDAIDADEEITLEVFVVEQEVAANKKNDEVNVVEEVVEVINIAKLITDAAQVSIAGNVVSTVGDAKTVSAATTTTATITTVDDITLAQALMEIKSTKPKEKGVVIQELGESTTIISSQLSSQQSQDKGKGILIEPIKPMKKKDLIRLDEEAALKLQDEINEEEKLAREKAEKEKEANITLI
ncbi:hypothetical protein Tco_1443192, partial [Tanacetum coccineum]